MKYLKSVINLSDIVYASIVQINPNLENYCWIFIKQNKPSKKQTIKHIKCLTLFFSLLSLLTFHSAFITDKLNKKEPEEKRRKKKADLKFGSMQT
jgi:hypothetical protein